MSDSTSSNKKVFSLRWQIALQTAAIVLVSLASLGSIIFYVTRDTVIDLTLDKLGAQTHDAASEIGRMLSVTRADTVNVPGFPPIPGIVRTTEAGEADADGSTTQIWMNRLRQILEAQMATYGERLYCVVIDARGNEIMRVERLDGNRFGLATASSLQNVAATEYFRAVQGLAKGDVYVTGMELDDGGRPVVFAITPYVEAGVMKAAFAIKLDGAALTSAADQIITVGITDIVDERGRYLFSDNQDIRTFDAAVSYEDNYPVRAERMRITGPAGDRFSAEISGDDRPGGAVIGIYDKIFYNPTDRSRFWAISPSIRSEVALERVTRLRTLFIVTGLGVLLVGLAVAFMTSTRLTSALRQLAIAADNIAAGGDAELPTERRFGEVSTLTDSLGTMTTSLRDLASTTVAILNATADALITINEKGTIRTFNTRAETLFGYTSDEITGQNVSTLVPSPHREQHDGYLARYARTGVANIIGKDRDDLEGQRKDGSVFPMSLRVTELVRADGTRTFIGTVRDISVRKAQEEEREGIEAAIRDAVHRMVTSSHQILATTANQSTGSQQQAATVQDSVATVQQLSQMAEQAAQQANAVADAARQSEQVTSEGSEAIQRSIDAMHAVNEQVQSMSNRILALSERAQDIREITETVRDFADQTNVLALNAAVEASRHGEQGKGFAVIADNVKLLALDSKRATDEVGRILREIQSATDAAVIQMEKSTSAVSAAQDIVQRAGQTIGALSQTVNESARSAIQISAATQEQATGIVQLQEGMSRIDQVTKAHAAATQEIELAVRDLDTISNELASLTANRD